jgi:DNA-binding GntR family transcriptional regulator
VELEHVAVLEAIDRGDADSAESAMRLHLLNARRRALSLRW